MRVRQTPTTPSAFFSTMRERRWAISGVMARADGSSERPNVRARYASFSLYSSSFLLGNGGLRAMSLEVDW